MLKEYINGNTLSLVIAIILVVITFFVARAIYYLVFVKDKSTKTKDIPAPKKKKDDDFAHCELNDIMGYDFIQVRTIKTQKEVEEVAPVEQKSFADSKGIGVTERMGTTGRDGYDFEGEKPVDIKKHRQNREIEKQNEELATKAREEGKAEITNEMMEQIASISNGDWPDNTLIDPSKDSEMDFMCDNIPPEELDDTSNEEIVPDPEQQLADRPKEEEKYVSLATSMFEQMEKEFNEMEAKVIENEPTAEQEDALRKLRNIGKTQKPTEEKQEEQSKPVEQIEENDIPDID